MHQWYQCPNCQGPVQYGVPYCGNCGQPLYWQQPAQQSQDREPPPKKKPNTALIVIGIAVLFLIIFVGSCAVCLSGSGDKADTPAETQTPTSNESTPQSGELVYLSDLSSNSTKIGTQMQIMGEDLVEADLYNEDWQALISMDLELLRMFIDEGRALKPPSSMKYINDEYMKALDHYYTMTYLINEGIDTLNIDLLNQAIQEMNTATEYISATTTLIENYNK